MYICCFFREPFAKNTSVRLLLKKDDNNEFCSIQICNNKTETKVMGISYKKIASEKEVG